MTTVTYHVIVISGKMILELKLINNKLKLMWRDKYG